jgi:hypothetical protein
VTSVIHGVDDGFGRRSLLEGVAVDLPLHLAVGCSGESPSSRCARASDGGGFLLRSPPWGIIFGVPNLRRMCESCAFALALSCWRAWRKPGRRPRTVEEAGAAASDSFAVMTQHGGAVMWHR